MSNKLPDSPPPFQIDNPRRSFYVKIFKELPPVPPEELRGDYIFVPLGPLWFTKMWMMLVILLGIPGLRGKEFDADGEGRNIGFFYGKVVKFAPIYVKGICKSSIDGKPSLIVKHRNESKLLSRVADDLRKVDDNNILGLGYYDFGFIPHLMPHPFLLRKIPS